MGQDIANAVLWFGGIVIALYLVWYWREEKRRKRIRQGFLRNLSTYNYPDDAA